MTDTTAVESQPQSANRWTKTNKKYLILLLGIVFIFILAVIFYFVSKQEELPQPTPQPTPRTTPMLPAPRVEDQIIIKFKPEVSESTKTEILKKYNATIIKRIDAIRRVVIQVPKGQEDAMLNEMKKDNLIEKAEPNYIRKATFVPNDPSLNVQWGLKNSGQPIQGQTGTANADVNAETAWDVTRGNGVKIAVLDTGINMNHPDLSSKIIASKDFTGSSVEDYNGHGTHTAGITAASTNNSVGISGTCPDCQLLIGKVLDDSGSGDDSTVADGIIWAADNGAKVISMSLGGGGYSSTQQDAIDYAWNKGVVLVAAAGNNGDTQEEYPGANTNVVSVAATDNRDQKASFSTYGTWVDVAAPGKYIYSTLPTHAFNIQQEKPGLQTNYDYLSGTSMATPMVSGVVGLIWASSYGTSNTAVVQRLYDTADKISGTGTLWIYGRVNAGLAVSGGVSVIPTLTSIPTLPPTVIPTPRSTPIPTIIPTPRYVTPTIYCLGSCPTGIPTPTPVSTNPIQPSINTPTQTPNPSGITNPTIGIIPTYPPGVTPYSPYESITKIRVLPPCGSYGDVDMDGFITSADADMIIDSQRGWVTLTPEQVKRADVDGDGQINTIKDWGFVADYLQERVTTFPVCSVASTNTVSPNDQQSWWETLLKFIGFK